MPRVKSSISFDPRSLDAQLATIIEQMKQQDRERADYHKIEREYREGVTRRLDRIQDSVDKTNGRVTKLERQEWHNRGFAAAVALLVGCIWEWITRK